MQNQEKEIKFKKVLVMLIKITIAKCNKIKCNIIIKKFFNLCFA